MIAQAMAHTAMAGHQEGRWGVLPGLSNICTLASYHVVHQDPVWQRQQERRRTLEDAMRQCPRLEHAARDNQRGQHRR
jgi:hypothetical protein